MSICFSEATGLLSGTPVVDAIATIATAYCARLTVSASLGCETIEWPELATPAANKQGSLLFNLQKQFAGQATGDSRMQYSYILIYSDR